MSYSFSVERFRETYAELEPLYRQHYAEMCQRLEANGVKTSPYAPRIESYCQYGDAGWLLTFVLRHEGRAVGYSNIYVTQDMHNGDKIAQEDTIFVTREHRNGIGKKLVLYVIQHLRQIGVTRLNVSALTDLRVAKLWSRMGFKEVATQMTFQF